MGSSLPRKNQTFLKTAYHRHTVPTTRKTSWKCNPEKHPLPIKASNRRLRKLITQKIADQRWSDIYVVFTKILCGRNFCVWYVRKLKFTGQLLMASLSFYPQFESNLVSNRKVIKLPLQLKSAKAHGRNYIKAEPHLVRHL